MDKVLTKIYMPSSNEVIEGLSGDVAEKHTNILKGT